MSFVLHYDAYFCLHNLCVRRKLYRTQKKQRCNPVYMIHPAELISKKWAISPAYARSWYPYLLMMMQGSRSVSYNGEVVTDNRDLSEIRAQSKPRLARLVSGVNTLEFLDNTTTIEKAPAGTIAIIPITGPIMKEDTLSTIGTEAKKQFLQKIYNAPNIQGVVLKINSGGGEVDGTMSFANVIAQRTKPVVAHVNGMAASAAYWIAMNADAILLNDATSEVGSIGVMMTFVDDQKHWENMGVKFVDLLADGSEDKNKGYFDAKKGKYQTIKNESLNPLRQMFANAVIEARGGKIDLAAENVLSGKLYFGAATDAGNKSAIDVGLADGFGNLDAAVNRVVQLAQTRKYNNRQYNIL